jgi:polyphosphate kinase
VSANTSTPPSSKAAPLRGTDGRFAARPTGAAARPADLSAAADRSQDERPAVDEPAARSAAQASRPSGRGAAKDGGAKASESAATATVRSAARQAEAPNHARVDAVAAPRAIVESTSTPNVTPAGGSLDVRRGDQVLATVGASKTQPAGATAANGYASGARPARLTAEPPASETPGRPVSADARTERTTAVPGSGRTLESADAGATDEMSRPTALIGFDVPAGADAPPPDEAPLPDDRYINRELSWLDFNARVLSLAEDESRPLLERAFFLSIFASNLDEFYMVRVAELKRRMQTGLPLRSADGMSIREQLAMITERSAELVARHAECFDETVGPELAAAGVEIVHWADLDAGERDRMRDYFRSQVFPVLTPLAVDPAHPFPYISGLALNLAVVARDPDGGPEFFARVKVPNNVPRLVLVGGDPRTRVRYLPLEDLIAAHLGGLFSGMRIVEHHVFRVTRNAELEVDDERDEDLLQALERELARRRFGPPVRLEVASTMSDHVLELLVRELDMDPGDVLRVPGVLDLTALSRLHDDIDRPELKDKPFVPATHPRFLESEPTHLLGGGETSGWRSVFAMLREGDVLVHHPYHSFSTSVQRFIEQAASDPNVLAIKQTLYRTSGDSPVIDALVDAAEAGKQVVVIVEVKARFDEQANIGWARKLEKAGCHVVYGLVGLKTHCKVALVVRQEGNQIRRYAHIGTGNYHPKTARAYEDLGLLTADPEVGADLTDLFNMLTGYSRQTAYRRLLVAPYGVRSGIISRIETETALAKAGQPALVQIKCNALVDEETIDALYRASIAGVRVELLIRSSCALRPGVPGLSENIGVRSILGRFLEHSRIYRFGMGDASDFWIGSSDLMHRNLDRRIEALVRVTDADAKASLDRFLTRAMSEHTIAFELQPDASWILPKGPPDATELQEAMLATIVERSS